MKTNQLLKSSLALVAVAILATVTAVTLRQGEVTKTAHLTAPKDILQFTSGGHVLGFAKSGVYVANGSHALRVQFVNAHPTTPLSTTSPSETGNTKAAPPLSKVIYANLWDGVTLTYDALSGAVARSTYRVGPYAKIDNIRLRYNAPVSVQGDGSLRVNFKTGTLNETAPQAWQERSGKRVPVQIAFAPRGEHDLGFVVGQYDRTEPLFIDPTLTWSTFLGGSGDDQGYSVAVDGSGNVYVAGYSNATWGSPVRAFSSSYDAFVAKLDSTGNLIWNTFLGGSGYDANSTQALALDGSGNVYVAGVSLASWGSPVRAYSGYFDAFVAKLDSSGNLIWNTFLGSSAYDVVSGLAMDSGGNVYVAGSSTATWGSPVRAFSGGFDAFVAKLDSSGNLTSNTFLGGGGGIDQGYGVAVDGSGNVCVAGESSATWGSPVRAYTTTTEAFAAKLDSSLNLIWNTFLGGSGGDRGFAIAVDSSGNAYVAGFSTATWGSAIRAYSGDYDGFAAKLDSSGNLIWNTFLGGSAYDVSEAVAVDGSGNAYVAGLSNATWGSPDRAFSVATDGFVAQLDSSGNLTTNTFLGGSGNDLANGLAIDGTSNVYVPGYSSATWGSPVRAYSGGNDAFVAKLSAPSCNISWELVSPSFDALSLATTSGGDVFAGSFSGIFRTTDDGGSWSNVGLIGFGLGTMAVSPTSNSIFAGSSNGGGPGTTFRSTDNGNSWTSGGPGNPAVFSVFVAPTGTVLEGTSSLIFRLANNESGWPGGWGSVGGCRATSFTSAANGDLLAGSMDGGVYRSTNDGASWTLAALPSTPVSSLVTAANGHIFAGTVGAGIFRSVDNGGSWTQVNASLTNTVTSLAANVDQM